MADRICSVPGCVERIDCRGMCRTHVGRWRRRVAAGLPCEPGDLIHPRRRAVSDICAAPGCEKDRETGKTFCSMHRTRLTRWGVLEDERRSIKYAPAIDRFVRRFQPVESGCWVWAAGFASDGYGVFRPGDGRQWRAHRWAYEWFVGPIPEGYQIDHLCSSPRCVNPDHLEPVTPAENTRRWVERKPGPKEKEIPWLASSPHSA